MTWRIAGEQLDSAHPGLALSSRPTWDLVRGTAHVRRVKSTPKPDGMAATPTLTE